MVGGGTYQPPLGLDERAILPVHLVIQAAGVTQIVTRTVPPPQRRRRGPAVDALPAFCMREHRDRHDQKPTHQQQHIKKMQKNKHISE